MGKIVGPVRHVPQSSHHTLLTTPYFLISIFRVIDIPSVTL